LQDALRGDGREPHCARGARQLPAAAGAARDRRVGSAPRTDEVNGGGAMATVSKLGPADHGRSLAFSDYLAGDYLEGYQYELIDGKLYVSPAANAPQGRIERWIYRKLDRYSDERPEIINYVHAKARVFVPDRPGVTAPE